VTSAARRVRTPAQASLRTLRRAQILAAARSIVAAQGLEALTVGALEAKLGYSRGVITYHFKDKDEIVAEVLASAVAEIDQGTRESLQRPVSVAVAVRAVLQTKVRGFLAHREASLILISFWSRAQASAKIKGASAGLYARYRAQSDKLIVLARAQNGRCRAKPGAFGAVMVGVVIGLVLQSWFDPAVDVDGALEEAAHALVAHLEA
jgi:AcrR family transcriptional regulator